MIILITEEQNKKLLTNMIGERVKVYYNLHKQTFSIQKNGIVVGHADFVKLSDVEFRVREGGKEKVRFEKRKNVHAFVIGVLEDFCLFPCEDIPEPSSNEIVTYNPYKHDTFVLKNNEEPVYNASGVEMVNLKNKIYITEQ